MDIDSRLAAKIEELTYLRAERDKIELLHAVNSDEPVTYGTPQELLQSGELEIMEEISIGEFNLLSIEKQFTPDSKPLTWRKFIDLKKRELEEHREFMVNEGYASTKI